MLIRIIDFRWSKLSRPQNQLRPVVSVSCKVRICYSTFKEAIKKLAIKSQLNACQKSKELILQVFPVPRFDFYHLKGPLKHSDTSQHMPEIIFFLCMQVIPSRTAEIAGATGSKIYSISSIKLFPNHWNSSSMNTQASLEKWIMIWTVLVFL